jgi:putative hemolysin
MAHYKYILLLGMVGLSACAAVYTDASDSNHVTFLNSNGESIASLTPKANAYCAQYGKTASFRKSDTQLLAVFDCNWPQSGPR